MKTILLVCVYFLLFSFASQVQADNRLTAKGYFKTDTHGKTFFIQRPGTLEPGVRVYFENAKSEKRVCKQKKPLPIECPIQEISFIPVRGIASVNMTKARLVPAATSWHRLKATEDMFGLEVPKSKK
jgi:hypothetical protein